MLKMAEWSGEGGEGGGGGGGGFLCPDCGLSFAYQFTLRRHRRNCVFDFVRDKSGKYHCDYCSAKFMRKDNRDRHRKRCQEDRLTFRCGLCDECYRSKGELELHRKEHHLHHHDFRMIESAHCKQTRIMRCFYLDNIKTVTEALLYSYPRMIALIETLSVEMNYYKLNFVLHVEMCKLDDEGNISHAETFPFRGKGLKVVRDMEWVKEELRRVLGDIERAVDEFLHQSSGWMVLSPYHLDAEVVFCLPLHGRSCRLHRVRYQRGKGITPVYSKDDLAEDGMCFYYAVVSHFLPRDASFEQMRKFLLENLVLLSVGGKKLLPVSVEDAKEFERQNAHLDLAVNIVYKDEEGSVLPVAASQNLQAANVIVLLLFHTLAPRSSGREGRKNVLHYARVEDSRRLFAKRFLDPQTGKVRTSNVHVCWNCFNVFKRNSAYVNHVKYCHKQDGQVIQMPEKGEVVSFEAEEKTCAKTFKSAYMLYFDFEALQIAPKKSCSCPDDTVNFNSMSQEERENFVLEEAMIEGEYWQMVEGEKFDAAVEGRKERRLPRPRKIRVCSHKSHVVREQPPFTYSYVLVDREGKIRSEKTYVGRDAADNFILSVLNLADKFLPQLSPGVPISDMSVEEREMARGTERCYLCNELMLTENDKVLDHDHLTGQFLGVAHNLCNLQRKERIQLTCFAHNFSGYDSHFLIQSLNKFPERIHSIHAVPLSTQKFKCITINGRIVMVDSFQFLLDSLSALVDTLQASDCSFDILHQLTPDKERKGLLLRKGVYPYSYATSIDRLVSTTEIPPIEAFHNDLKGEACSREDYEHARKVWKAFGCRNMLDYTVLYVKSDVYLLAEVVTDFRNNIWRFFGLDMCQYLSLPHLAKDIMLKTTEVEIELIHDKEMSDLLQHNIRGGLSFVNLRHAEKKEGSGEEQRSLLYVDATNLYGKAMCFPMPVRDFQWMTRSELETFDPATHVSDEEGEGYILEVDLKYPSFLHLPHNSFPLAAETANLIWEDLSPYSRDCLKVLPHKRSGRLENYKATKLTATFRTRRRYLLHGLNLKLYLQLGLKLLRIRRGIKFYQTPFIRDFIQQCTLRRKMALTMTEQTMWKLICNSVYGKVSKTTTQKKKRSSSSR